MAPISAQPAELVIDPLPALPEPVSNNAVALVPSERGVTLYSMQGLSSGRGWTDIHNHAWKLAPGQERWQAIEDVPGDRGRLAGAAAVTGGQVWLFGGYTVAEDGGEVSSPGVYRLEGSDFRHVADMPVAVDDMTAFTYLDRYVYLVSGWHDLGNVNLVQVLDTQTLSWEQATPYPGAVVFGHAGGMVGRHMLVCDGVKIEYPGDGAPRRFVMSDECWLGEVDEANHRRIDWRPVPPHPGPARYRIAATGNERDAIIFAGGTGNPYNYDGIGYNGEPSEPEAGVLRFNVPDETWASGWSLPVASMDHRSLAFHAGWYYLVGGMEQGQAVSDRVLRWRFSSAD